MVKKAFSAFVDEIGDLCGASGFCDERDYWEITIGASLSRPVYNAHRDEFNYFARDVDRFDAHMRDQPHTEYDAAANRKEFASDMKKIAEKYNIPVDPSTAWNNK